MKVFDESNREQYWWKSKDEYKEKTITKLTQMKSIQSTYAKIK